MNVQPWTRRWTLKRFRVKALKRTGGKTIDGRGGRGYLGEVKLQRQVRGGVRFRAAATLRDTRVALMEAFGMFTLLRPRTGALFFLFCAVTVMGQERTAPRISNNYPASEDIRKPDLTIAGAVAGAPPVIAYNPSGRCLAVASADNTIRIYDARPGDRLTSEPLQTLRGHTGPVIALGFKDTNILVSVSADQTVKTWDVVSGKLLGSTELHFGGKVIAVLSPDKQPLLAGATLKRVSLWNYQSGELLRSFDANDSPVSTLAFTLDGKWLVIGTSKGVLRVMDVAMWKVARTIDLDSPILALAANTNRIVLGYADGTIGVLNFDGRGSVSELTKHSGAIEAIAFSLKGEQFASASADGTLKVWDTASLKVLCSQEGHRGAVRSVAFSPNGQKMASGGADGNVNYWTVPSQLEDAPKAGRDE